MALGFALVLGRLWAAAAIYWIVGLAFGFVLQRSRFCFTAAFRDLFLLGDGRMLRGVLAGLGVATVGFAFVMYNYVPRLAPEHFPAFAGISPVGPTTLIAGLIFGFGMVIAGGCMSGNLYRIGEGYLASVVALLGMLGGLIVMMLTWNWWYEVLIARQPMVWLPHTARVDGGRRPDPAGTPGCLCAACLVGATRRHAHARIPRRPGATTDKRA